MASFEPIVIVFGSSTSIASVNLRFPVSFLLAFDVTSLEQIVNTPPQLSDICLQRYFVVLLDSIEQDLWAQLVANHRVLAVHRRDMMCVTSQNELNQMTNSLRQLTLDLTNDIVRFLTSEGQKQISLERMSLVKIYYQQARVLKEWAMSFFKAEPCHILLISLNSSQSNLDSTQQRLQKICTKLGYTSAVIRQFNDYVASSDRHSSLLPYAQLLFNNEDPNYMCRLIKKLSPIRLYLYGNELCSLSEWSKLMISTEIDVMADEDNWCAFLENERVDNEVKWNFAFTIGREWKVSRVSPLDFDQLDDNPRFHSALRRAHTTVARRQIEVTAEIFDWYGRCIERGHLQVQPKLTPAQETTKYKDRTKATDQLLRSCIFRHLPSFDYPRLGSSKVKSMSFIWLDEMLHDSGSQFHQIIEPFQWQFFDSVSLCMSFIEAQLRDQRYIFFVASGALGRECFFTTSGFMRQIFAAYIYCAHLNPHLMWSRDYASIRGVFNDPTKLADQIKRDYIQLQSSSSIGETNWVTTSNENISAQKSEAMESLISLLPLPLTVYNPEQGHPFIAHQRTIDTLLCMPHTLGSKEEMIAEFRRMYNGNQMVLVQIDNFENNYNSHAAVEWYTRESFVWRTINRVLRSSDADAMFKLRHILTDLYSHLHESHSQRRRSYFHSMAEIFYRGQVMSTREFDYFKDLRGNIISINVFLSTTSSMQVALMYAGKYQGNSDLVSVVFNIEIDSGVQTRPYANISQYSSFPDEDEVLFAMGCVFRIGNIRQMLDADNVWIINLKMIDQREYHFSGLQK